MGNEYSIRELYNQSQANWIRREPTILSDFTARPALLSLCEPVSGLRVLDLGCGEGYCSRELYRRGAREVYGLDLSERMIAAACQEEAREPLGIQYQVGNATELSQFADQDVDLVLAVFLFNYLDISQTRQCMAEIARVLRPGGRFVLGVPHPAFPYLRSATPPFFFQVGHAGYFSGRDHYFDGCIWKRDGTSLDVRLIHKTFQDYFEALQDAGFNTMPTLHELRVTPDLMILDAVFFGPLEDVPLHVALSVVK